MDTPPVTMRQVAREAGVSLSTVSLALRHDPRLAVATVRRVCEAAERLGYRPDPTVNALMARLRTHGETGSHGTFALLNATPFARLEADDAPAWFHTFAAFSRGIRRRAAALGYGADEFWLRAPGLTPARLAGVLHARGIRGVLLVGFGGGARPAEEWAEAWAGREVVAVGAPVGESVLAFAANDQFETTRLAVRQAWARGYRRPGLALHAHIEDLVHHRFAGGFYAALEETPGVTRLPVLALHGAEDFTATAGEWYRRHRPDVVLTHETAWLELLRGGLGVRVPEEAGLVHLDLPPGGEDWAGVAQDSAEVGAAAADLLALRLHRQELGEPPTAPRLLLPGRWVDGPTLGRLR
ncbi:MAG: LacI family DNA-binding transcriptional regulator [Verrucomicrobiota bacterium]